MGSNRTGLTDPLLDVDRYVNLECSMPAVLAIARGRVGWPEVFEDGSVTAAGDPALLSKLAEWFRPALDRLPSTHLGRT
jgi:hypothetical protein